MKFLEKYISRIDELLLGIQELDNWLLDVMNQGLAVLHQQETAYFESIASRLVDLKLSSIARRIRRMEKNRQLEDWSTLWQREIAELQMFSSHFKKIKDFPELTQIELLQQAGLNLKKKEILEEVEPIKDYWIVLGQHFGLQDEKMNWRRVWLWAEQHQCAALLLDFAWGNTDFPEKFEVGAAVEASLSYYPSSTPLRALVKEIHPKDRAFARLDGIDSLQGFILKYTEALSINPGLNFFPGLLSELRIFARDNQFYLCDKEKYYLPLSIDPDKAWKLLASSGGNPLMIFGTWDGYAFQPLSCLINKRIVEL